MENEDDEDVLETEVSDLDISQLKTTNEETKPDFDSGRQLMEWLRMKLEYLEVYFKNMYKTAAVLWVLVNLKLFVDACMYKILVKFLLK